MDPESQTTTRQRRGDIQNHSLDSSIDAEEDRNGIKQRYKWREPHPDLNNTLKLIIVTVFIGLLILFVKYTDGLLPRELMLEEENSEKFIEERARVDLHDLTNLGPRVSGSAATDVQAVQIFIRILEEIKHTKSDKYNFEFEVQRPSGTFFMDDDEGHISSYSRISNVVAKLEAADPSQRSNYSVLFNCHSDTKVGCPGATDNIISCSVMLEMIRVLSKQEIDLRNTLLFLFNGAEEYGLQGAHGFVASNVGQGNSVGHPWSKSLRAFVNFEGAGAGGSEILFQSGPGEGWILNAYAKNVPHPYGLVIAEEAFQRGFIPSDTDFRIFRDFSNLPGLDMAFIKNGWIYHTKLDKLSEIPPGSIQHMGDNALALGNHFGNLDFDDIKSSDTKMVFFDLFGGFMISYTEIVGKIINTIVAIIAISLAILEVFLFEKWTQHKAGFNVDKNQTKLQYYGRKMLILVWLLVSTILAWGAGALAAYIAALIFNAAGYDKPFYSYPSLSYVLFGIPAILAQTLLFSIAHKGSTDRSWMAGKFTLAIILIPGTFITRIVYVITINLLFGFLGFYVARLVVLKSALPKKNVQKLVIYLLIGELIPFTIGCYLTVTLSDVFVPIMGRSGSETNANIYFGLIVSSMISIIAFSGLISVFVSFKKRLLTTALVLSLFLINPLIVFGFIGKIPYQEKTPMRVNVVNMDRIWYEPTNINAIRKSDSAYWFWQVDSNTMDMMSTFRKTVSEIEDVIEVEANSGSCEDLYCALPFIWPTTKRIKKTPLIPKNGELSSVARDSVKMTIVDKILISPSKHRLKLRFEGPSQTTFVLSPGESYHITNWSLTPTMPPSGLRWHGRDTYFVYHGKGYTGEDLEVTLDLEKSNQSSDSPLIDIVLGGHFLHGPHYLSEAFTDFIERFPSWTYVMGWSSVLKLYTILV